MLSNYFLRPIPGAILVYIVHHKPKIIKHTAPSDAFKYLVVFFKFRLLSEKLCSQNAGSISS